MACSAAIAASEAVSVRRIRGPDPAPGKSGAHSDLRFQRRKAAFRPDEQRNGRRAGRDRPASSLRRAPASDTASLRHIPRDGIGDRLRLSDLRHRLRPHCSHAAMAIASQCACLLCPLCVASFTTLRSVMRGTIRVTPSSVAFCTMASIRSPRAMPCSSVMCRFDSRSTRDARPLHDHLRALHLGERASYSPPRPSNRVSVSPGAAAEPVRCDWRHRPR